MTSTEPFMSWLEKQINRSDPVGALARFVRNDPCWGKPGWPRFPGPDEVDDHLVFHRAPHEVVVGMRQAWQEWEQARP